MEEEAGGAPEEAGSEVARRTSPAAAFGRRALPAVVSRPVTLPLLATVVAQRAPRRRIGNEFFMHLMQFRGRGNSRTSLGASPTFF